jgi:hypothetical protein
MAQRRNSRISLNAWQRFLLFTPAKALASAKPVKQETLHRHILEALEADTLVTKKVNLYDMDMTTSRALNQLRHAEFIQGIFQDIYNGPVKIEGIPIITLKGQEYLDRLRSRVRQNVWRVITVIWAVIIGLSSIRVGHLLFVPPLHG